MRTFTAVLTSLIEESPVTFSCIHYRNESDRDTILNIVLGDLIDAAGGPRESPSLKLPG